MEGISGCAVILRNFGWQLKTNGGDQKTGTYQQKAKVEE